MTGAVESSYWWPEEFWQRGYWLIFAAAIVLGGSTNPGWRDRPVRWVLAGLLAVCTAAISLPVGEGWEDVLPLQRGWLVLLSSSCLLGFWALDQLSITNADRWFPLTILAMLAGPLLVAVTTYTGLVQWTIAAIAATLPLVGFALFGWISSRTAAGLAYPAVVFTTTMMSAGRFYSYENHPWWTYLGLLLVPLAIVSADYPLRHRPTWLRMLVAAAVSLAVIGLSAWLQYNPETAGAENW